MFYPTLRCLINAAKARFRHETSVLAARPSLTRRVLSFPGLVHHNGPAGFEGQLAPRHQELKRCSALAPGGCDCL